MGPDDQVVHFPQPPLDLGLLLGGKSSILQKRTPERPSFSEVVPDVAQRLQIVVRHLSLKPGQGALVHSGQRFMVQVQEGPLLIEVSTLGVVCARYPQHHVAAPVVIHLENIVPIEATNQLVAPFTRCLLGKRDLDLDRVRGRRVRRGVRKVEIECLEDDAPARSKIPETNPQHVEHRRLARVVFTDEDRDLAQIEIEFPDPPEVSDAKRGNPHGALPTSICPVTAAEISAALVKQMHRVHRRRAGPLILPAAGLGVPVWFVAAGAPKRGRERQRRRAGPTRAPRRRFLEWNVGCGSDRNLLHVAARDQRRLGRRADLVH